VRSAHRPPRRSASAPPPPSRGRLALAGLVLLAILVAGALSTREPRGGDEKIPFVPTPAEVPAGREGFANVADPYAWAPSREKTFSTRAAAGNAHVLYANSPGGAQATAARTALWRALVDRAAQTSGVEADLIEALVFLESGGRPDALTPAGTAGAAGLGQILPQTARDLLGMRVDEARSARLGRQIRRALRRGDEARARTLARLRRTVDERFDPPKALAATGRYLALARERFGRDDLALVSYHMGMGNLEDVLADYGRRDVSWAQVFFDSTPREHAAAYRRLRSFADDSANYFWKLLAAREIMRMHRSDPAALARQARLQTAKNSAEEVLRPAASTDRFATPAALSRAWRDGLIRALPDAPALTGLKRAPGMGELGPRIDAPRVLYRGLRPEALALALYVGAQVRDLNGGAGTLTITSAVRDQRYQDALVRRNREATRNFSLHTTGYAFDVARVYESRRQALAFQWVLDRLQALHVIAWVREPQAIHITAGPNARDVLPLLERLDGG
jgi:hypothetical protein